MSFSRCFSLFCKGFEWCSRVSHGEPFEVFASPLLPNAFQKLNAETQADRQRKRRHLGNAAWFNILIAAARLLPLMRIDGMMRIDGI